MTTRARVAATAAIATALSSTALAPTYDSLRWLPDVWAVIALVALAGVLARRLSTSPLLPPLGGLAVLTGYVTAVFAPRTGFAVVVPGSRTIEVLQAQVRAGIVDVQQLAVPVPVTRGLLLLTVLGVGAVAVLVDLVAMTLGRAALAGLPLLALFAIPAAVVPGGVGWLPFALGAAGYLGLLLAEGRERIGRWGRPLGFGQAAVLAAADRAVTRTEVSPLAQVGRRIGAAALGVALVVPALVPGLPGIPIGQRGGGGGIGKGHGVSSVTTYNPIAELKGQLVQPQPRELLRVTTDDRDPDYLRMTVLDQFNGEIWSQSQLREAGGVRVAKRLPDPPGLTTAAKRTVHSRVTVRALRANWLPVPYPARKVSVDSRWHYDAPTQVLFSARTDTRNLTYDATTTHVTPDAGVLARTGPASDPALATSLQLPAVPNEVRELVQRITASAKTPYQRVLAIQNYFRGPLFSYDVSVPEGHNTDRLLNFLAVKRGYCEQYAAAMAIMTRLAGVPSRVGIGFTRGARMPDGSYSVSTADAHAWPEAFFPGAGWLRFEPTPRGDGQAVTPAYAQTAAQRPTGAESVEDLSDAGANGPAAGKSATDPSRIGFADKPALDFQKPDAPPAPVSQRPDGFPLRRGLALATVLALLAAPVLVHAAVRRRRWSAAVTDRDLAHAAWAQVQDDVVDLGHPWRPAESPRRTAARLVRDVGLGDRAAAALWDVAVAEEQASYARSMPGAGDLRAAVGTVRRRLLATAAPRRRWLATLLPPSTLRLLTRRAGVTVADALDRIDALGASMRLRLAAAGTARSGRR